MLTHDRDVTVQTKHELEDDVTSLQLKVEKLEEGRKTKEEQIRVKTSTGVLKRGFIS